MVDMDRADRGDRDLDPGMKIERHAECEEQGGADDIAMADDQHRPVAVGLAQIEKGTDRAFLDLAHTLAARNGGDAAAAAPHLPALVCPDSIKGQTSPFAEIEL